MKPFKILVWMIWCMVACPVLVFSMDLVTLQKTIDQSGARWKAGVPAKTNPMRLGLLKGKKQIGSDHSLKAMNLKSSSAIPGQFDWRNVDGKNYVTPVRDQGQCGSCWAFSIVGALESLALIELDIPGTDLDLSEQAMVSCSSAGSCNGGPFDMAAEYVRKSGVPLEACYTYRAYDTECGLICNNSLSFFSGYAIRNWVNISEASAPDIHVLKTLLTSLGPISVGFSVYEDFLYYESGIYSHISGEYQGDHGVLIVGYDDREEYFIVKNSWGPDWGENGYFRIAYSEMKNDVKFAMDSVSLMGLAAPENRIVPEITANGQRNIVVGTIDPVSIAVSLNPVNQPQANNRDWWIWMSGPTGTFGYDVNARKWQGDPVPIDLPVFQFNSYKIWNGGLLTPGYYQFFFAIDDNNDGMFDGTWQSDLSIYVIK